MADQKNEDYDDGELVIDASGNVAQKGFSGNGGWWVLGWIAEEHPFDMLTQPIQRLGPVSAPPAKGRADTSLYRITYNNNSVKYGPRRVLGPVVGHAKAGNTYWSKVPVKIERAVAPQFTDVTDEFL